jgi:hypothetical protein
MPKVVPVISSNRPNDRPWTGGLGRLAMEGVVPPNGPARQRIAVDRIAAGGMEEDLGAFGAGGCGLGSPIPQRRA